MCPQTSHLLEGGNGSGVTCEVEEEGEASGPCVDHGAREGQHSHPGHLPGQEDDGHEEPEAMPTRHDDLEETAEEDGTEGQVRVSHCHLWCYLLSIFHSSYFMFSFCL